MTVEVETLLKELIGRQRMASTLERLATQET
jgi:hypothetical protein